MKEEAQKPQAVSGFSWDPDTGQIVIIGETVSITIKPIDVPRLRNMLMFATDAELTQLRAEIKKLRKAAQASQRKRK